MEIQQWLVLWLLGLALLVLGCGGAAPTTDADYKAHVHTQCSYTRFPSPCVETLSGLGLGLGSGSSNQHVDFMIALANKTISEAQRAPTPTGYCPELMSMSMKRLRQAQLALRESPTKNKHDIQTWLSAALTFQETCKETTDARAGRSTDLIMDHLSQLSSNLLALANRITSSSGGGGGRRLVDYDQIEEERVELFPRWVSARNRKLLQSNSIQADAIVAKDGSGNYGTISEAIQAASGNRFVIYVKAGVYKEKIHSNKDGITLIGDGKYSTIIVGADSRAGGSSLSGSATFTITGDRFIARDIGFQNNAGPQAQQAVALSIASDHSVLYRCSIAGYQDTLYALALRQFYRECDIYGTIDFIFGNAAAVFQSCQLVLRRPGSHGSYNVILANGRSDPGQSTGFSIQNCRITVGSDFSPVKNSFNSYLGRPWKEYSRAVVMQTTIDDAITPRGWVEWPGTGSSALRTLYFGEYANVGPGARTSARVNWPGFHLLARTEAVQFTVGSLIAGTSWLPSTGVTFVSGL